MLLAIVFAALLWEFPFLPRQLSAVDSYTIGIPAFLLAFSSNPQKYQVGFLKRAIAFCIPTGIVTALGVISLALVSKYQGTWMDAEIQTGTAIILSITGLWVLSTATRPLTRRTVLVLLAMSMVALGLFVTPGALSFFGFVYLNQDQLIISLLIASITAALIELVNTAVNSRLR
jgi:cation-transporting ATPase E